MYLGGMGGTGKSQVIKALIQYFKDRREPHRFIVLAPTGSAAVLVDGSTYHSVLGIRDIEIQSKNSKAQIKDRLTGVEYIFVDEVSMLSCGHMYVISKQLATALSLTDIPFGGMNMIFAGDFAQLPPVKATPLYDYSVGTSPKAGMTLRDQECTVGKAIWHQITTVVILRQNMRQKIQSDKDAKFRTALENMRFKSCTDEDVEFLQTLIAKNGTSLAQKRFAHIPIITSFNTHRDKINEEGTRLFATRHNLNLYSFYSIDSIAASFQINNTNKTKRSNHSINKKKKQPIRFLNKEYQEAAWKLPPSSSDHLAGRLDLCIGLPVIIKKNIATECCITNGAPALVWGWKASPLIEESEKMKLDILFVKLVDPPKDIQLEGLPKNVVPISRQALTVTCHMPNDKEISIVRQQVHVLPNFAITVHASQGRTRTNNICDLSNCKNHLAIYTALSRSSSANGTAIIQGFDKSKIQGGITGYLRQEFRELEILDEITTLRFEDKLNSNIVGNTRSILLHKFYENRSITYIPKKMSELLKWSQENPLILPKIDPNAKWRMLSKKTANKIINTNSEDVEIDIEKMNKEIQESQLLVQRIFEENVSKNNTNDSSTNNFKSLSTSKEEKINITNSDLHVNQIKPMSIKKQNKINENEDNLNEERISKQIKLTTSPEFMKPLGLKWSNMSCAYDAILLSLHTIWKENSVKWSEVFVKEYKDLFHFPSPFNNIIRKTTTLEHIRWKWRDRLTKRYPQLFATTERMTCIYILQEIIFEMNNIYCSKLTKCTNCHRELHSENISNTWYGTNIYPWRVYYEYIEQNKEQMSIQGFINFTMKYPNTNIKSCCQNKIETITTIYKTPYILALLIPNENIKLNMTKLHYNKSLVVNKDDNNIDTRVLYLKAIIYAGDKHFVIQLFDRDNNIWYHDGEQNKGQCILNGQYENSISTSLNICKNKTACAVIYSSNL